ncbi:MULTISPECIES: pilin major subunit VirB2 [Rhizobium]|nr:MULTISPECIES: pilin major subunit VirB2 [Rhizobium]
MRCFERYRLHLNRHSLSSVVMRLIAGVGGAMCWSLFFSGPVAAQSAGGGTDPVTMVNNICTFILGPFGQSLAVLGIVAIGISWMFGRASLGLVAGVVGGIVIMFGASFLGKTLIGGG